MPEDALTVIAFHVLAEADLVGNTVARSTGSSNVAEIVKCNVRVATDAGIWAGFDYCFPDPTSAKPWAAKLASTS